MNAQKLNISIILLFWSILALAQSPQAFLDASDKAFEKGDYYTSMKYLEKSLEMDPENVEFLFKHAEAAKLFEAYAIADASYSKVLLMAATTYPEAYFGLGRSRQAQGQYESAYQNFQKYLGFDKADVTNKENAAKGMADCEWALEEYNKPAAGVLIERMGSTVNSPNSDFGAIVHDGKLYFTSFKDQEWGDKHYPKRPIARIMTKEKDGETVDFFELNSAKKNSAHTSFTPKGDLVAFNECVYIDDASIQCGMMLSQKLGDNWGLPVTASINMEGYTTTEPSFGKNEDGKPCLYFVSDRPGGKGGLDLWYANLDEAGVLGVPINLERLNTKLDDITPFYDFNENVLYFSTNGLRTLGGFDIYKAALRDGAYNDAEHLPIPFNSSGNDIYFVTNGSGEVYFSSNRTGSMEFNDDICCYDIYKGEYLNLLLETFAFEKSNSKPLNQVVYTISEIQRPDDILTKFSGENLKADFEVERTRKYQIIASKDGFMPDTIEVPTLVIPDNRKFIGNLYLEPIDLSLSVLTYNQISKSPLAGVKIKLIEMEGLVKEEANTEDTNERKLKVRAETPYLIVGTKDGYTSDSVVVAASELRPGAKLTKNLFLTPGTLGGLLPVALYFDNDEPDKRTTKEVTSIAYNQAYDAYYARKEEFKLQFTKKMSAEDAIIASQRLENFFEKDVKGGYLKLENFADNLDLFMENGYVVEIMVKGFASPLANTDYNLALTKRRIVSVLNYFRQVRGGLYAPFFGTGQLLVTEAPFGETASPLGISDRGTDRKNSVFSVEASLERRAEIIEIRLTRNRSLTK